jgi:steroid delta-isomerase
MTPGERVSVWQSYARGLTENDLEGVVALFAADAVVRDPVDGQALTGLEAIRAFYDKARFAVLDMVLSAPIGLPEDGSSAAAPVRVLVRRPGGQLVILETVQVFEFAPDGQVARLTSYYGSSNVRPVHTG